MGYVDVQELGEGLVCKESSWVLFNRWVSGCVIGWKGELVYINEIRGTDGCAVLVVTGPNEANHQTNCTYSLKFFIIYCRLSNRNACLDEAA